MRGKTLAEKRYGSGYRPEPVRHAVLRLEHCAAEPCKDPIFGSLETYVDDAPPALDWYTAILAKLARTNLARTWVTVPFCEGHLTEFLARSVAEFDEPDTWAPGRESPAAFPHPPKLVSSKGDPLA